MTSWDLGERRSYLGSSLPLTLGKPLYSELYTYS